MAIGENSLAKLVFNPKDFFDKNTKIIYVKLIDNNPNVLETKFATDSPVRLDTLENETQIPSGTELYYYNNDWIYVPYNIAHEERRIELLKKMEKQNLCIHESQFENINIMEEQIKSFRKAYRSLHGGINANSMYLYSGPKEESHSYISLVQFYFKQFKNIEYRIGCVYTGDGNLSEVKKMYKKYWRNVGTIQLPHHGCKKNCDFKNFILKNESYYFFASFGNNNTYGHPSKDIIINIQNTNSFFFPVSETLATEFIEQIQ